LQAPVESVVGVLFCLFDHLRALGTKISRLFVNARDRMHSAREQSRHCLYFVFSYDMVLLTA